MSDADLDLEVGRRRTISKPILIGIIVGALVFVAFVLLLVFSFAKDFVKQQIPPLNPRYELRCTFLDDQRTKIHHKLSTLMDVCRIMPQCFADTYPSQAACQRSFSWVIDSLDSGFWVEMADGREDRLVGFVSIWRQVLKRDQGDDYHALHIYNVCVDRDRRGQGVGTRMIPKFIDAVVEHYGLQKYAKATGKEIDSSTGLPIPPLVIGLSVDLDSDSMPDAFSVYSKLGFVRWWTPCDNLHAYQWSQLIDIQCSQYHSCKAEVTPSSVHGWPPRSDASIPLGNMLWAPSPYLSSAFKLGTEKPPSDLCMFKFYSDSFPAIAKSFVDQYQSEKRKI